MTSNTENNMTENNENTSLTAAPTAAPVKMGFETSDGFEHMQRVAKALTHSKLVPQAFQGEQNIPDAIIALNMANRMHADPMAVMQNLYIVHGKPAWSSSFLIATVNACGRFSSLRFRMKGKGDQLSCHAVARDKESNEELIGSTVSIEMAKNEGWYQKKGSKWQTMPEQMLQYRAATFWVRVYAPEISMGMRPEDEIRDIEAAPINVTPTPAPDSGKSRSEELADQLSVDSGSPSDTKESSVPPAEGEPTEPTFQDTLQDFLSQNEISFTTFQAWLLETGRMKDADSIGGMSEMPTEVCQALLAEPKSLQRLIVRAKDINPAK